MKPGANFGTWARVWTAGLLAIGLLAATPCLATGTVTAWDYNGGKLEVFSPAGLSDVVEIGVISIGGGYALKKDGSVYTFSSYPGYEGPTLKSAGPWVNLSCSPGICWVRAASGAWTNLVTSNITPPLPANLNTAVSLGGGYGYGIAVNADGTATPWGNDQTKNGSQAFAKVQALVGVQSVVSDLWVSAFLMKDGTVKVISFLDTPFMQNIPTCNQDGTLLNIPPGVVATQIALGDCLGAALRSDGTVVTWGYNAPNLQPPAGIKKVRKVQADWNFTALQVDGTVVKWGTDGSLDPTDLAQKTNIFDIAQGSGTSLLLHSSSCGGISWRGCCQNDKLSYCSDTGSVVTSSCTVNSCGWAPKGGALSTGAYACSTGGGVTPVGAPYKACVCDPVCTGKVCGNDGCGGSCGTCGTNTACDANGACKCTLNCDDGNACTDDSCDASGCTHTGNTAACSTGKCSTGDKCVAKSCVAGPAISCNDNSACTNDSCDLAKGCQNVAVNCDDGNPCTNDSCVTATGCQHVNNTATCTDGNACTQNDVCNGGACKGGAALNCDDGLVCTTDACNPSSGCTHSNNTVACSDNNACTQNDTCGAGSCKAGSQLVCNDNNPCTDDACDNLKGCTINANTATCSDNNACTNGDVCSAGKCQPGNVIACDDGQVCTTDGCDAQKGCTFTANSVTCDDGNVCSTGDTCQGGKCAGTAGINCDDGNPCTDDPCDGKGGCATKNKADGSTCDDGDACTTTGLCTGGKCGGFQGVNCDDGLPCTLDSCDKTSGCKHSNSSAPCDDGNPCTAGDACSNGACQAGPGCASDAVCTLSGGAGLCVCKAGFVGDGKSCSACIADCKGKVCGGDGCGGSCGTCSGATVCSAKNQCVCAPQCDGKSCGPDGCGGSCGACKTGEACNLGSGVCAAVCVPQCKDKECGADGCGGSCGACGNGQFCLAGKGTCRFNQCPSVPPGGCCAGNTLLTCDAKSTQAKDCNSSGTYCDWDAATLAYGCMATTTGSDPSGKSPRACSESACTPDCKGKTCGADGCGGSCGSCSSGKLCDFNSGLCQPNPCEGFETAGCCKDGVAVACNPLTKKPVYTTCGAGAGACGWTGKSYACEGNGQSDPSGAAPKACPASLCVPDCKGKACGSDGCGGTCGACSSGAICKNGGCCTADCKGKNCGSDGCGGTCGTCLGDLVCNEGNGHCMGADQCQGAPFDVGCCDGQTFKICQKPFTVASEDCSKSSGYCGWDAKFGRYGCGTQGLSSPKGQPKLCKGSLACTPDCKGKQCGPDGCGGTCPSQCETGMACTPEGLCVWGCGEVTADGCCEGGKLFYCGQKSAGGDWGISSIDCGKKGMGCGYSKQGTYACVPGQGSADPSGNKAMVCPASLSACAPDCTGKTCGPDGCGGTCGSCQSFEKCEDWSGTCYVPPADCDDNTWQGTCSGATLTFCSASSHTVTKDCGTVKEPHNGQNIAMCKWVPTAGAYGCEAFVDEGKSGYPTCNPDWGNQCGVVASYRPCQCDLDCQVRGDCCSDFVGACGEKLGVSACGDGTCNTAKGEGCATCPADCKAQCVAGPSGTSPPWLAPFASVLAMADKPPQHAEMVLAPLDDPLPAEPPVPQQGLLTWLPGKDLHGGGPQTHVVQGKLGTGALVDAVGVQGPSLGLLGPGPVASGGVVQITVEKPLPRPMEPGAGLMGGLSLAMWVKLPAGAPDTVQPLASTFGPAGDVAEVCAWSRPQDASLTLQCENGQKIVGLYGYYGAVQKSLLPQWNAYYQSNYAPQGYCALMAAQGATHACEFSEIQPWLEAQCLGKATCHIDPWLAVKDPCVQAPDPNIQSTLMVRALCAKTQPVATALLAVGDVAGGRKLRFEVPGLPPLVATSGLQGGDWHHVALVHRPFLGAQKAGVTTLYVDGKPEATSETLVPPTFDHLWLGAAVLANPPKGAPNLLGGALAAVADLDDAYLYDRALSDHEVRALRDKPGLHVAKVWPGVDPQAAVAVQGWVSGGKATTAAVTADKLLGPAATTQGQDSDKLKASYAALHVPAGAKLQLPMPVGDLGKPDTFTLAAWLKLAALPGADKPFLQLTQGGVVQLAVSGAAACDGRALQASVLGGAATQVQACEHGLQAGRWAFVSLVQKGNAVSLRIDGHEIGVGTSGAAILPGAATVATLEFTGELDVAWATLFDAALPHDDLERWRSQGPAVWLDGAVYLDAGVSRLRDYVDFQHAATGADVALRPVAWGKAGTAAALSAAQGPLVLAAAAGAGQASAVTVPALGRIAPLPGSQVRSFSWSGHLTFTLPAQGVAAQVPLVEHRPAGGTTRTFGARLVCQGATSGATVWCHVEAVGPGTSSWSSEKWPLSWPNAAAGAALDVDLDLALAWDGTTPKIAVGSRASGAATVHDAVAAHSLKVETYKVEWPVTAATWPSDAAVLATVAPSSGASVQLPELRVYTRALSGLELEQLVRRACADLGCDHRTCSTANAAALPACGPCDASHFEAGDQMGDFCLERRPFFATCTAHEQCASHFCAEGRCQAKSQTTECTDSCGALHRTCVSHEATVLGAKAKVFGCSSTCVSYYATPVSDATSGPCVWAPTTADGQTCDVDAACVSGKCVTNDTPKYAGGTVGGTVCAFSTKAGCDKLHRDAQAIQSVPLTGKPAYTCSGCSKELYLSEPLWHEAYSLMTHAACDKGSANATWTPANDNPKWELCFHNGEVSLKCLGILLLKKSTTLDSADIAKLRKVGIGPDLLRSVTAGQRGWSSEMQFCYCGNCPTFTFNASPFQDPKFNHPICVGTQYPNGTTCPPPGVSVSADDANQFCESGFCARDTHQCEDGVAAVEDTRAADRQDAKESKKSNEYGPITVTQTNRATLDVHKIKQAAGSQDAPKRAYTVEVQSTHAASVFGSASFDVISMGLSLHGQMDDKKAQYVPHIFVFGIEQPKVKSATPPSGCAGATWIDGEYKTTENCGIAADSPTSTPTLPQIKFCPPVFKGCEKSKDLPKGWEAGPTCLKRSTFVGPVPVSVEASARLEVCINMGLAIDSQTFEPAFKVGPEVDLGVEVKGGVGVDQLITVFAGIKGTLSLLKLGFPVSWFLRVEQIFGSDGTMLEGLFKVAYIREVSAEMTILRLTVALFAEVGFGPFKAETEYPIFDFPGFNLSVTLGGKVKEKFKLDLTNPLADQ
jgi:hypothetical protein